MRVDIHDKEKEIAKLGSLHPGDVFAFIGSTQLYFVVNCEGVNEGVVVKALYGETETVMDIGKDVDRTNIVVSE